MKIRAAVSLVNLRVLVAGVCSVVSVHACACSANPIARGDLSLNPAAAYLVAEFSRFPLVAFSEPGHGAAGTKAFLTSLITQPGFAGTVNDIVVEFGNARYQSVVDRYISGEPVDRAELKQVWENTTIVSGVWSAPVYEEVLKEFRNVNARLPAGKRIRVLLGDPPIDWSVVRGPADEDTNDWRDAHFAWVVEERVMKRGHRALLWIGGAHISRQVRFPDSLIHLLDRRFPHRTLVALAVDARNVDPRVVSRFDAWPTFAASPVSGTWFGRLDAVQIGARYSTGTVEQNMDVAIFWQSMAGDDAPRVDSTNDAEVQRRRRLAEATVPFRGGRIRFERDAAMLTPDSDDPLRAVLAELRRDSGLRLLVKAFTDAREAGGAELSWNRARVVVDWLTAHGISSDRLVAKGCASVRALWVGHTEEERAANRRAELVRLSKFATCEPPASFEFR
jgi:outer membrane protein OmpA-like peptidoglycan-associated protein